MAREIWDRLKNITVRIKRHENLKSKRNYTSAPTGFYKRTTGGYLCVCWRQKADLDGLWKPLPSISL